MSVGADEMYEIFKGLYDIGLVPQEKMDEFMAVYRQVPRYDAEQIRALRARTKYSQEVFARLLNVSLSAVRQWESGAKRPDGASCKLLQLLEARGVSALIV